MEFVSRNFNENIVLNCRIRTSDKFIYVFAPKLTHIIKFFSDFKL